MNPIKSIYIPRIESKFNAEFIANIFERNDIAEVSRVYIEPCKSNMKNKLNELEKYNIAYIEIFSWYGTETAYNFIECLVNHSKEARIVCGHNKWWTVHINNYPHKLDSRKHMLTIFKDNNINRDEDNLSTTAIADNYIYNKNSNQKKIHRIDNDNKYVDELKAKIYGYKNAAEMKAAEAFDGYLHEKPRKTFIN